MSAKPKSPKKLAEETNPDFQLPGVGNYVFVKTLGEGNFAKVKLAKHKMTGQEVAIKIIDKTQLDDKKLQKLYREVRIMKMLHHPNIVRLYEVVETKSTVFLVMEYSSGGELYDYLVVHGRMKEKEARAKFRQILSAVSYCHKKRVIHRDLKAENLLLDGNLDVKIADFGFSNQYDPEGKLDTFCGSPPYAAPELFQGRRYVGPEVDVWSLGVILYVLTTGCLPFDGKNLQEMRESVCRGKYRIPFYLSDGCEKLLRKFLVRDPTKRATLDIIADDPWLNEGYTESCICTDLSMRVEEDDNLVTLLQQKFQIDRETILKSLRDGVYDDISALYYLMYHERDKTGDYSRVTQVLSGATLPRNPGQVHPQDGSGPALNPAAMPPSHAANHAITHNAASFPATMPMAAITLPRMPAGGSSQGSSNSGAQGGGQGNMPVPAPIQAHGNQQQQGQQQGGQQAASSAAKMMAPIAEDGGMPANPRNAVVPNIPSSASTARSVLTTPRRRRFTVGADESPGAAPADGGNQNEGPGPASPLDKPSTAPVSPVGGAAAGATVHTSTLGGPVDDDGPGSAGGRKRGNTIVGILRSTMGRSRTADGQAPGTGIIGNGVPTSPTGGAQAPAGSSVAPSVDSSSAAVDGPVDANKPRSLRFTFNSNTTSSKPPDEVVQQVVDACNKLGVAHKPISRYLLECSYAVPQTRDVVRFEVEVCKLPRLKNLHGLKFKRLGGPSNDYKVVCESVLANVNL